MSLIATVYVWTRPDESEHMWEEILRHLSADVVAPSTFCPLGAVIK